MAAAAGGDETDRPGRWVWIAVFNYGEVYKNCEEHVRVGEDDIRVFDTKEEAEAFWDDREAKYTPWLKSSDYDWWNTVVKRFIPFSPTTPAIKSGAKTE